MNMVAEDWSQDCCSCKKKWSLLPLPFSLICSSGWAERNVMNREELCTQSQSVWHVTVFNTWWFVCPKWLAVSQLLSFSVATLKFEHIQESFHSNQYYRPFGHGVKCYKSVFYLPEIHFSDKIVYIHQFKSIFLLFCLEQAVLGAFIVLCGWKWKLHLALLTHYQSATYHVTKICFEI